jgi:hypothetical protein
MNPPGGTVINVRAGETLNDAIHRINREKSKSLLPSLASQQASRRIKLSVPALFVANSLLSVRVTNASDKPLKWTGIFSGEKIFWDSTIRDERKVIGRIPMVYVVQVPYFQLSGAYAIENISIHADSDFWLGRIGFAAKLENGGDYIDPSILVSLANVSTGRYLFEQVPWPAWVHAIPEVP